MAEKYVVVDRSTPMFFPPDMRDWLPEDHMVHFILEAVEQMPTGQFKTNGRGSGSAQYPPSLMLALLVYSYATGRFSSRDIEQASYYDVAVRYICCGEYHPDHDTICKFRRENKNAFEICFVKVLAIAQELGHLKKVGTISVDGTKIHANASKHSAVSYGHAQKQIKLLEEEVMALVAKAEGADKKGLAEGLSLPEEISRREIRKKKLKQASKIIEERFAPEYARKQEEYQARMTKRKADKESGKQRIGRTPKEPENKVPDSKQYNFTDPESRIMKAGSNHFDQCYNAQASVEVDSMLVVNGYVTEHPTDKNELSKNIDQVNNTGVFIAEKVLGDNGYYGEEEVSLVESSGVEAYISAGKENCHKGIKDLEEQGEEALLIENANAKERMRHKLKSLSGKELYKLRKQTVEPVFGIIKQAMGFRQFLLRGKEKVNTEWTLVCMAYNMKRLFNLSRYSAAVSTNLNHA